MRQQFAIGPRERVDIAGLPVILEDRFAAEVIQPISRRREGLQRIHCKLQAACRVEHTRIGGTDDFATGFHGARHHFQGIDAAADPLTTFEDLDREPLLLQHERGI